MQYLHGVQCDAKTFRSVTFRFECSPSAGAGYPQAVQGNCEFVVVWPTTAACKATGGGLGASRNWSLVVFAVVVIYVVGGTAVNVYARDKPLGIEALPNYEFWATCCGQVQVRCAS